MKSNQQKYLMVLLHNAIYSGNEVYDNVVGAKETYKHDIKKLLADNAFKPYLYKTSALNPHTLLIDNIKHSLVHSYDTPSATLVFRDIVLDYNQRVGLIHV